MAAAMAEEPAAACDPAVSAAIALTERLAAALPALTRRAGAAAAAVDGIAARSALRVESLQRDLAARDEALARLEAAAAGGLCTPPPADPLLVWIRVEDATCCRVPVPDADADASDLIQMAAESFAFGDDAACLRASQLQLFGADGAAVSNRASLAAVAEAGGRDPPSALTLRPRHRPRCKGSDDRSEAGTIRSQSPAVERLGASVDLRQRLCGLELEHQSVVARVARLQRELEDCRRHLSDSREHGRRLEQELRRERDSLRLAQSMWGRPDPLAPERRPSARPSPSPPGGSPRSRSPMLSVVQRRSVVSAAAPARARADSAALALGLSAGDAVEVRDGGSKAWMRGVVQKVNRSAVLIQPDGWKKAFTFRQVRREVLWPEGEEVQVLEDERVVQRVCLAHPKLHFDDARRSRVGMRGVIAEAADARCVNVTFEDGVRTLMPTDCLRKLCEGAEVESPVPRVCEEVRVLGLETPALRPVADAASEDADLLTQI